MRRRLIAIAAAVAVVSIGACSGSSAKDEAKKVALAYERAKGSQDYATQWRLGGPKIHGDYRDVSEFTVNERALDEHNGAHPWPAGTNATVDAVSAEAPYYRVRVRLSGPGASGPSTSDVIVRKYNGHWLVADVIEPGFPIPSEP